MLLNSHYFVFEKSIRKSDRSTLEWTRINHWRCTIKSDYFLHNWTTLGIEAKQIAVSWISRKRQQTYLPASPPKGYPLIRKILAVQVSKTKSYCLTKRRVRGYIDKRQIYRFQLPLPVLSLVFLCIIFAPIKDSFWHFT